MQIEISGQHVEVTDAIRTYLTAKYEKLQHHFNHINRNRVV